MKKKFVLAVLFCYCAISYGEENKVNVEFNVGSENTLGVEGLEPVLDYKDQFLDLMKSRTEEDYDKNLSNVNPNNNSTNMDYVPKFPTSEEKKSKLLGKYLGELVRNRKKVGVKISEDYIGLGLEVEALGKFSSFNNSLENNSFEDIRVSVLSKNKYLSGKLNYYSQNNKSKTELEKILNNDHKNKYDYDLNLNANLKGNIDYKFNIRGNENGIEYNPEINYKKDNIYVYGGISISPNSNIDILEELDKLPITAPGYDKIEYYKKWSLKEEKPDLSTEYKYKKGLLDLENAEVSGYKATTRLLNKYSGSLYGTSTPQFLVNTIMDEINKDENFKNLSIVLNKWEETYFASILGGTIIKHKDAVEEELKNRKAVNELSSKILTKLYNKFGFGEEAINSKYGLLNQVPSDFNTVINGDKVNLYRIDSKLTNTDYLYFDKFLKTIEKKEEVNNSNNNTSNNSSNVANNTANSSNNNSSSSSSETTSNLDYILVNRKRDIMDDFKQYLVNEFILQIEFDKKLDQAYILGHGRPISKMLSDPFKESKGLEMLRNIYFYGTEKDRNIVKFREDLSEIKKEVSELSTKKTEKLALNLGVGYKDSNYDLSVGTRLFNSSEIKGENLEFKRFSNDIYLNGNVDFNNILFKHNSKISYNNNDFKYKNNRIKYNTLDIDLDNYIGYKFKNNKWDIDFGLQHLAKIGFVSIKDIVLNDKEYKINVAKRDDKNNPYDVENNVVITTETTEQKLLDLALKNYDKNGSKKKREFLASDAIMTKEEKPNDGTYKLLNIFIPKIQLKYNIYDNLEISNETKIPIIVNRNKFHGVGLSNTTNIKYTLNEKDFYNIENILNPLSFKTDVRFEGGFKLNKLQHYAEYNVNLNSNILKANINGNLDDIYFNVGIMPNILNLDISPSIYLSKDEISKYSKVGIEYRKGNDTKFVLGLQKAFWRKDDDLLEKIKNDIDEVLTDRNIKEKEKFDNVKGKYIFSKNLEYNFTPFAELENRINNVEIGINYQSLYGKNEVNSTNVENIEENNLELVDSVAIKNKENKLYFIKNKLANKENTYFNIEKLTNKIEKIGLNFKYENEIGFNLQMDASLITDDLKYEKERQLLKSNETGANSLYAVEGKDISEFESVRDSLEKLSSNNKEIETYIKNKNAVLPSLKSKKDAFIKKLAEVSSPINESNTYDYYPNTYFEHLSAKNINLKTNTNLSYKFKTVYDVIASVGLRHSLDLNYKTIGNVDLNDVKLYGSSKLTIINKVGPEIGMKYKIDKNISLNINTGLELVFNREKYTNTNLNIKTGLEYKW